MIFKALTSTARTLVDILFFRRSPGLNGIEVRDSSWEEWEAASDFYNLMTALQKSPGGSEA